MINSLPNNPRDADKYQTYPNLFVFNKEDDTWKNLGAEDFKLVSSSNDGMVFPKLYDKLKSFYNSFGKGFKDLRLTDKKCYFYYFYNSDSFIKFIFDDDNLWIEINKSVLARKIMSRTFCVGEKGRDGLIGQKGRNGDKAVNERFISSSNGIIDIDVFIDEGNNGPISIRGYDRYRIKFFEVLLNLDGTYEENDYFYYIELNGNNLKLKLKDSNTLLKIRQVGPDGINGTDGVNHIVVNEYLNDVNVMTEALIDFNKLDNNLVFKKEVLAVDNCIFKLNATVLPISNLWIGVEVTLRECKLIEIVDPLIVLEKPALDLPLWTPIPGCYDQRRYEFANFNWMEEFNLPFEILPNPEPKYNSCAIPFWFCGNSGNAPCDAEIEIDVPVQVGNDYSSSSSSSLSSSSSDSYSDSSESSSKSDSSSSNSLSSSSSSKSLSTSSSSSKSLSTSSSSFSFLSVQSNNSSTSVTSNSSNSEDSVSSGPHIINPCVDCGDPYIQNNAVISGWDDAYWGPGGNASYPFDAYDDFGDVCRWTWRSGGWVLYLLWDTNTNTWSGSFGLFGTSVTSINMTCTDGILSGTMVGSAPGISGPTVINVII